jgi:nicotinamidase-related amidase
MTAWFRIPSTKTALLVVDLQNDFIHADGAYARGGQKNASIAALPARLAPLAAQVRSLGGLVIATQFTLVPGRGGEPLISPHLRQLRPFSAQGRFRAGVVGAGDRGPAATGRRRHREGRLFGVLHDAPSNGC